MSRLLAALAFSFTCLLPCVVQAAPGDLDATFGGGAGWVSTPFALKPDNDQAFSVIRQLDGKLVAAGYSYNGNNNDFSLVRYNSDGALDATFNGTGKLTTAIGASADQAYSVIQQADGKLVAAGYSNNGSNDDFALVRYNSDGTLDTTFNGTGKLTTAIGASADQANSVIQQADGKLVVAGWSSNGSDPDFALARYNSDGTLDTTFNGTGKLTTDIGASTNQAYSVIQQADGKLVVAGYSWNGSKQDFALVRYNSDGTLDTTFNGAGKLTTAIGAGTDRAYSVVQQADGKLVAAGYSSGSNDDFALVRYNSDGSLDTTFNGTGKLTKDIGGSNDQARSVIQQADGKLVVAGYSNNDFALVRYNSDGSLDTTFNGSGKLTTTIGTSVNQVFSVIQQVDGKLVAAGIGSNGSDYDFVLVRYNGDGSLDTTFSDDGKLLSNIVETSQALARSVIRQADGKLVAAGYSYNGTNNDFALVRYNSDGALDTTFNGTGKLTTAIGAADDQAYSVIQQADGKLVVAGYSYNGTNNDFALVRYNSNGTLDTTFNGTGKLTTAIGTLNDYALSVIQQADGKLVAAGYSNDNGSPNYHFALVRYNSDGTLDTTFNGTGKLITAISGGYYYDYAQSVIQQADGKLVVAGFSQGLSYDFVLVRYNSDGSLDTSFNGTGKLTTAIGGDDFAYSVIQQADGKLVVAGRSNKGSYEFALARYNIDGTLDTSFNGAGTLTTAIGAVNDIAYSVAQQADGKLVVAGFSRNSSGNDDFALVRYNGDGTLDTAFNGTGKRTVAIGTSDERGFSVIQQMDGKLAVAGYAAGMPTGQEFVVARFESGQPDTDSDGYVDGLDNCNGVINPDQLNTDGDSEGNACDNDDDNDSVEDSSDAFPLDANESADSDNDGIGNNADTDNDNDSISDADEITLGNDPLNNLDPPRAAISSRYIVGVDNHDAAAEAYTSLWNSNDGTFDLAGTCPECVAPGFFDMVMASSADVCGVNATGMHCLWWVMDSGPVEWPELLPVEIAGQTVNPIHDWDGWLKYVDGASALHYLAKDAFRISGDHATHACFVSKSTGVYCWANHSGTDIVSGNIPASLRDVSTVKDVAVGANHACAINNTAVQCWGEALSNKITVPAVVNAPQQLAAGANHTCAINADNTVSCWGDNSNAQLGDADVDGVVDGVSNALRISAGANHTCAVTGSYSASSSLRVSCWGSNSTGQTTVPVDLTNGNEIPVSITAAADETCAIRAGQNVAAAAMVCWPVGLVP